MTTKTKMMLESLVMKETLELMIPIIYCMLICIAYYGPNADILGNIKNDYWQYEKLDDVKIPVSKVGVFVLVDMVRIMFTSIILWKFCKINFFHEYCWMMRVYWIPITTKVGAYMLAVS